MPQNIKWNGNYPSEIQKINAKKLENLGYTIEIDLANRQYIIA